MVKLKSRTQCPVGGFVYVDAPISAEPLQTWDFESLVQQIIARRRLNPRFNLPTDEDTVRAQVDLANAMRMQSIRGADIYIITDEGQSSFLPARRNASRSAAGASNVARGAAILVEWIGEGGVPVEIPIAEKRASICVECPKNDKGDWTTWFTQPASDLIRQQLGVKNDLKLSTSHDEKLNVCSACGCPLKLKVFTPMKHIKAHLSAEAIDKLDERCWITKENN